MTKSTLFNTTPLSIPRLPPLPAQLPYIRRKATAIPSLTIHPLLDLDLDTLQTTSSDTTDDPIHRSFVGDGS
jgi:hypothetical protein